MIEVSSKIVWPCEHVWESAWRSLFTSFTDPAHTLKPESKETTLYPCQPCPAASHQPPAITTVILAATTQHTHAYFLACETHHHNATNQ